MTEGRVLDEHGFVKEGEHVLIVLPAYNTILPLRIKAIKNKEAEWWNYGPVPYTFSGYNEGEIKARSATSGFKFKDRTGRLTGEQAGDMFYHKKAEKLIHAYIDIRPHLFRIYREIPTGVKQVVYLDAVTFTTDVGDATADFGYTTGVVEQFFLPNFHIDWYVANWTNMDLKTNVMIKYAEYEVEIPRDAETIFSLMMRKVPAHWYTLPVTSKHSTIDRMFTEIYGFAEGRYGIPFYRSYEREKAISEIPEILKGVAI